MNLFLFSFKFLFSLFHFSNDAVENEIVFTLTAKISPASTKEPCELDINQIDGSKTTTYICIYVTYSIEWQSGANSCAQGSWELWGQLRASDSEQPTSVANCRRFRKVTDFM